MIRIKFLNLGWRYHPNFKWDRDQQAKPQFRQPVQQPIAPIKATWEIAIDKLGEGGDFDAAHQDIQKTSQNIQNIKQP